MISSLTVDDRGLSMAGSGDRPVDVRFSGARVLSFWLERDTTERDGRRFLPWPEALRPYLNGTSEISLTDPTSGEVWASAAVRLGEGEEPISVVDRQGNPLGMDKSNRLMRLFGDRSENHLEPLLDSMESALEALRDAGVEPFVAYGTLLGAVREQNFLGHDSDADLAYVSRSDHPVDVAVESFRLERHLQRRGFRTQRYSGLAFKVSVLESDGQVRGLDVFGGFLREGILYLMGEVGHPFETDWVWPLSEVTLADRTFPAPHQPEHLLEAMYGPGWRTPDPAFKFETPITASRRLNGWFRGLRVGQDDQWARRRTQRVAPDLKPSQFSAWVYDREPDAGTYIDLGCGSGGDTLWLARQGRHAIGLDYMPTSYRRAQRVAGRRNLDATFDWVRLTELRSVLPTVAALSREPGPRVVTARHVLDATNREGRRNMLRMARVLTRSGGRFYVQFAVRRGAGADLHPINRRGMERLVAESGGRIVESEHVRESTNAAEDAKPSVYRMVISWDE